MTTKSDIPDPLRRLVTKVGDPVAPADVDTYGKIQRIRDHSHRIRSIIGAWKKQQAQDRVMRQQYAKWLIWAMGAQAVTINVIFIVIGCGKLKFEPWTAKAFILAVFSELAAMVFFIVKYLFRCSSDKVLELAEPPMKSTGRRGKHADD